MEATLDTVPTIPVSTERSGLWPYLDGSRVAFEHSSLDWSVLETVPGAYMFAKKVRDGDFCPDWEVIFVGEAGDLARHLRYHKRWKQAEALGATHIIVRPEADPLERESQIDAWIWKYSPPLNPAA